MQDTIFGVSFIVLSPEHPLVDELTTSEYKALQSVTANQQAWLENAIQNRARIASDEIVNLYTTYKIGRGEAITAIGRL